MMKVKVFKVNTLILLGFPCIDGRSPFHIFIYQGNALPLSYIGIKNLCYFKLRFLSFKSKDILKNCIETIITFKNIIEYEVSIIP